MESSDCESALQVDPGGPDARSQHMALGRPGISQIIHRAEVLGGEGSPRGSLGNAHRHPWSLLLSQVQHRPLRKPPKDLSVLAQVPGEYPFPPARKEELVVSGSIPGERILLCC